MQVQYVIYIAYLAYLAYEDYKYKSIRVIDGALFSLIFTIINPENVLISIIFALMLYVLRLYGIGDVFVVIATVSMFGIDGIFVVLISLLLAYVFGIIIRNKKIPYIPMLLVGVISWQLLQLSI